MEQNNTSQTNRLDEVKQLIFGQEIEHYNGQITELEGKINQNQEALLGKLEEVKTHLSQVISTTEQSMRERLQAIEKATQEELKRQNEANISKQQLSETLQKLSDALKA